LLPPLLPFLPYRRRFLNTVAARVMRFTAVVSPAC
jgi:hypothetical protein